MLMPEDLVDTTMSVANAPLSVSETAFATIPDESSQRRVCTSQPWDHLRDTIATLQKTQPGSAYLVPNNPNDRTASPNRETTAKLTRSARRINALVFAVVSSSNRRGRIPVARIDPSSSSSSYVLAVLPADDRVDVMALSEQASVHCGAQLTLALAPGDCVADLCGFAPGCVPPLALSPPPLVTILEASLLMDEAPFDDKISTGKTPIYLLGGGGSPEDSLLVSVSTLRQQPSVHVASFRLSQRQDSTSSTTKSTTDGETRTTTAFFFKPFFAIEPPPEDVVQAALEDPGLEKIHEALQPVTVTIVGRIARARRLARRLVFCDLAPPSYPMAPTLLEQEEEEEFSSFYPWRSVRDGQDMAVQIIAGKTLCQRVGDHRGTVAMSKLTKSVGRLVMMHVQTNMHNRESLQNWLKKKSMDLVAVSFQMLQEEDEPDHFGPASGKPTGASGARIAVGPRMKINPAIKDRNGHSSQAIQSESGSGMPYLSIDELYGKKDADVVSAQSVVPYVSVVDSLETIHAFSKHLSELLLSLTTNKDPGGKDAHETHFASTTDAPVGLVGIDCEWRPSFFSESRTEPQPVLLMQVCLHSLKQTFLLDLQTLLRPLCSSSEPMNLVETAVSETLSDLLQSMRLVKVGFQLVQDLRRLAASYPHVPAFQLVHAVLETSRLAKKIMHLQKQRHSRTATSSLSRLTEHVMGRSINKEQQCSDWSLRPLTPAQIEYAALDAVVTPVLVEKLVSLSDAKFYEKPQLGRWQDDTSFTDAITSWRFVLLDAEDQNPSVLRKLNAKRIIGNPYVVTQNWITGDKSLQLPSAPNKGNDGSFVDAHGILRISPRDVAINTDAFHKTVDSIIGVRAAKSKDRCIEILLKGDAALPHGGRIDFPQRSGFVEFKDAVILFVNMPNRPGKGQPRSYPNEFLEQGQILTWFLRESDWKQGASDLAKKLLADTVTGVLQPVVLFVRTGKGHFICCGRCRVATARTGQNSLSNDDTSSWDLIQLYLMLQDWSKLLNCKDFHGLVYPGSGSAEEEIYGSDELSGSSDSF